MSETSEQDAILEQVKVYFNIDPSENENDGWNINDEVVFVLRFGFEFKGGFLLSTPLDNSILQIDNDILLERAADIQRDVLVKYNATLGLPDDQQFYTLQQVIYPETGDEACKAIEKFLELSGNVSAVLASAHQETQEEK